MEDTLVPFTPTDAERQQPQAQEYIKSAGHITNLQYYYHHDEPDTSKKFHGRSGSEWDVNEANAVRAVPLLDLPPERIVPARFFPEDDQPDFANLRRNIRAASIDDLKAYNDDHFLGNLYQLFFHGIAGLITTYTSESTINRVHQRRISNSSTPSSELSTSSNEGKSETSSVTALTTFAKITISYMKAEKHLLTPGPREGPNLVWLVNAHCPGGTRLYDDWKVKELYSLDKPARLQWKMAEAWHVAINDGLVGVNFPGIHSESNRTSELPVIHFECKTRDAGGVRRRSGERERFIPSIFAQEVSEMVGCTIVQRKELLFIKHSDQEAFVVSMHGTLFYISAAYFSPEYIGYIQTAKPEEFAVGDNLLWVRRSIHLDMKCPNDRIQALRFFWALVKYTASGEARSDIVAAAIDAARDIPDE